MLALRSALASDLALALETLPVTWPLRRPRQSRRSVRLWWSLRPGRCGPGDGNPTRWRHPMDEDDDRYSSHISHINPAGLAVISNGTT